MKKAVVVALALWAVAAPLAGYSKKKKQAEAAKIDSVASAPAAPAPEPAVKLASGLEYRIIHHGTSTRKPVMGDKLELTLIVKIEDSTVFDSHTMNNGKPVPLQVAKPKFQGDPVEGYMLLHEGDSAVFRLPVDTLLKSGNQMPPWMKAGKTLEYDVMMKSVKNDSEVRKEAEQKLANQKATDDKALQDYFAKNNLHPTKTASGMYYVINKEGTGNLPQQGNVMSMFYVGKFLSGNIFDTNEDSTFHHQDALKVELGKGKVIKGWDEGLALLKKGSSATLFIPSYLAYGPRDRGPIPGNSVLIFDVTVMDIQTQDDIDEKLLQDYFKEKKIKPMKTASGLYYTITKKGKGVNAKDGQTVSVNYTGKTLDGKAFDSNTDSAFHHRDPLKFELGKGRVIKGWDEGLALLNKGSKATLYIPSRLAYGPQGQGKRIPPNAILMFDVELLDMKNNVDPVK